MKEERLYFVENLRVFLIILVILQHVVRACGSVMWWFVKDVPAPALEHFTAVNSSFFMSLFFVISFYFLPGSYDKKGFWKFHADRFLRLGVPLLFYVFAAAAPMMYYYFIHFRANAPVGFGAYFTDYFLGLAGKPAQWSGPSWPDINLGHLWFIEHLGLYGILYSLYRLAADRMAKRSGNAQLDAQPTNAANPAAFPGLVQIGLCALIVALVAFVLRLHRPLYDWIGFLGFIQIEFAHFPFYAAMFFIGLYGARNGWLTRIPESVGKMALTVGVVCGALIALMPVEPAWFGGPTVQSFAYTLTETFACFGLVIGLLYLFRKCFSGQNRLMKLLAQNTYLVYIIHLPIVVIMQNLLLASGLNPYLKFALISVLSVPVVFAVSILLRKIPYLKKYV